MICFQKFIMMSWQNRMNAIISWSFLFLFCFLFCCGFFFLFVCLSGGFSFCRFFSLLLLSEVYTLVKWDFPSPSTFLVFAVQEFKLLPLLFPFKRICYYGEETMQQSFRLNIAIFIIHFKYCTNNLLE